jgi:hypothetical protein
MAPLKLLKSDFLIKIFFILLLIGGMVFIFVACPGKPYPSAVQTNTVSIAEIAEAVASGIVTTTSASLNMAKYAPPKQDKSFVQALSNFLEPQAYAGVSAGLCATFQQNTLGIISPGSTCVSNADNSVTLAWGPCNNASPFGTWSGGETLRGTTSVPNLVACGGFPAFAVNDTLQRVFFIPTSRIANASLNAVPVTVLVDTSGNFSSNPPTSGYYYPINIVGENMVFKGGGVINAYVNGIHLVGDVSGYITWDYTVSSQDPTNPATAPSPLVITAGSLSGNLFVQDNLNKAVVKVNFGAVTYTNSQCGVPSGGGPVLTNTLVGTHIVETLTAFNAINCGAATLNGAPIQLVHAF